MQDFFIAQVLASRSLIEWKKSVSQCRFLQMEVKMKDIFRGNSVLTVIKSALCLWQTYLTLFLDHQSCHYNRCSMTFKTSMQMIFSTLYWLNKSCSNLRFIYFASSSRKIYSHSIYIFYYLDFLPRNYVYNTWHFSPSSFFWNRWWSWLFMVENFLTKACAYFLADLF